MHGFSVPGLVREPVSGPCRNRRVGFVRKISCGDSLEAGIGIYARFGEERDCQIRFWQTKSRFPRGFCVLHHHHPSSIIHHLSSIIYHGITRDSLWRKERTFDAKTQKTQKSMKISKIHEFLKNPRNHRLKHVVNSLLFH